jgi:hypothetical protein
MKFKEVPTEARPRNTRSPVVLCLALLGIVIMAGFAARGSGEIANVPQEHKKVSLSVQDPRPVAKAIVMLEVRYGWIITYEDPRYVYADDIADVTEKVRNDLHKYREGEAPRVLIPKGGELSFGYDVKNQPNSVLDPLVVVQQLLAAQAASPNAGKFRMERDNKIIHVIPSAIRDRSGRLAPQQSALDTVVTLAAKERTGLRTLEALCAAVSKATQTRVVVGTIPLGLFLQHKDHQGISSRKARDVLVQLLESIGKGTKLSWQLFYDPGMKIYALNIHAI